MQCCHCNSYDTKRHGKGRYKCKHCGRTFVEWINSPFYRYRFSDILIGLVVMLYIFMPTNHIQTFIFSCFGKRISDRTIRDWHRKFHDLFFSSIPLHLPANQHVRLHADEKFITVGGEQGYWWSLLDEFGNLYATIVTMARDLTSAKQLVRMSLVKMRKFGVICDAFVSDGAPAYIKAMHLFGRQCEHIVTGIQGKAFWIHGKFYPKITNNNAESLNSQLDKFLAKYSYSFPTLKAANDAAKTFQCLCDLKQNFRACAEHRKSSQAGICELQMIEALNFPNNAWP